MVDKSSARWLRTFCVGFSDIAQFAQPDTSGMGKQQTITTIARAYHDMAGAAKKVSTRLDKLDNPSFAKSKKVTSGVQKWLHTITSVYGKGSKTIASGSYDTPSDLKSAVQKIESKVDGAVQDLGASLASAGTKVKSSLLAMPQCDTLINGY